MESSSNSPVPPIQKRGKQSKINHITLLKLVKALEDGTMSCAELAEETGLHYVTVLDFCRTAHRYRMVHIAMWEKDSRGRPMVKIYKWGNGRNAKRESKPGAERSAAYRAKKKQQQFVNLISLQESA